MNLRQNACSLNWGMNLTIGQLADDTHETVKTLRYWTNLGLLDAQRGENGYRYYCTETVNRVAFIRSTQALGFTLRAIQSILALRDEGVQPCQEVRDELTEHLRAVRSRITELQHLETALASRLAWAEAHPNPACEGDGCIYLTETPPSDTLRS